MRSSSVVLPEPGELIRLTATTPRLGQRAPVAGGELVVAGQQVDLPGRRCAPVPACPCGRVRARGRAVVVGVVPGPVTRTSAPAHPQVAHMVPPPPRRSTSRIRSASPPSTCDVGAAARRTAAAPRRCRTRRPQARQRALPGRLVDLQHGPLQRGPRGDQLEAEPHRVRHHAGQPRRSPAAPGAPAAGPSRWAIVSTIDWVIDSSCISRCAAAGRRPAGRRCGCRRTRSAAAPARAGRRRCVPITAAPSPSGCACSAASAASARSGATTATSRPSQATYIGSMPSSSDAPLTTGRIGSAFSSSTTATPDAMATSLQMVATPPRVASRSSRTPSPAASSRSAVMPCSGAVSETMSASMSSSPRASITVIPWSPIGPDTSTTSPGWAAAADSVMRPLQQPDAGGGDVAAVGLAALDDLGVAGDDLHAGGLRGRGHRGDDPLQVGDREALLQDEPGRQVQRPGAAHGQVVHRAVDGQVADVAAREEQRRDHVGVGGEGQPAGRGAQRGAVLQLLQHRVAERLQEHRLDQRLGGLAAGPVGQRDPFLADAGLARAGPGDPLQHLLLAGQVLGAGVRGDRLLGPARPGRDVRPGCDPRSCVMRRSPP